MKSSDFHNTAEELDYWKKLASESWKKFEEERNEFEDFQCSSKELEAELETHIKQLEAELRESKIKREKTNNDFINYKTKTDSDTKRMNEEISFLEDEVSNLNIEKQQMKLYIRELEQQNDDYQRAQRIATVSLEDFESKLNNAIERNAFLENELDEKEDLQVTIQRLRDEARDLQQEVFARQKINLISNKENQMNYSDSENHPSLEKRHCVNPVSELYGTTVSSSENVVSSSNIQTPSGYVVSSKLNQDNSNSNSAPLSGSSDKMKPSARITALNIVGDLIQKIGHLEGKILTLYQSDEVQCSDSFNFSKLPQKKSAVSLQGSILQNHEQRAK